MPTLIAVVRALCAFAITSCTLILAGMVNKPEVWGLAVLGIICTWLQYAD